MKLQMNDTLHSQIRTGLTEYILQVQRLVIEIFPWGEIETELMTVLQMRKYFFHESWFELHYVRGSMTNNTATIEDHNRIFYQMTVVYENFQPTIHREHIGRNH